MVWKQQVSKITAALWRRRVRLYLEEISIQRNQYIMGLTLPSFGISGHGHLCITFCALLNSIISIDDFAWHDIPDSINHILQITKSNKLSYIGFSQGTAQAFAALSIHPELNEKVSVFIALAPAMSPPGLAAPIVDALMKAS